MSIQKVRRSLAVRGAVYFGAAADAGIERSAAGTLRLLGSNDAAPGTIDSPTILTPTITTPTITGGASIAGGTLTTPTLSSPTMTSPTATGGTFNMQDGRVRIGTVDAALGTTTTLPTDVPGLIRVGVSGGTPQIGFVVGGTAYVLSAAAAGTGAVSMFANPA